MGNRHVVRRGAGFVLTESDRVDTVEEAVELCRRLDSMLVETGFRAILFDTRVTVEPGEAVRGTMWDWVSACENFDRAAIVVESEMKRTQGNMTALSRGARLKSFNDYDEAVLWLTAGR